MVRTKLILLKQKVSLVYSPNASGKSPFDSLSFVSDKTSRTFMARTYLIIVKHTLDVNYTSK